MTATSFVVPRRFRGPEASGNGGWTAGTLAGHVPALPDPVAVEVTLRRPPPLETPLRVDLVAADEGAGVPLAVLLDGETVVAEARAVATVLTPVDRVDEEVAARAMASYRGLGNHPFPGCFACGPEREEGDGLRIFPGPVAEETVAGRWVPDPSLAAPVDERTEPGPGVDPGTERVAAAVAWAALDCVGGWSEDLDGRPMVLGRMTARVDALPVVGEPHVVVGRRLRVEGRKSFTASTLYDADGRVCATAEHVWIAVDPAAFR